MQYMLDCQPSERIMHMQAITVHTNQTKRVWRILCMEKSNKTTLRLDFVAMDFVPRPGRPYPSEHIPFFSPSNFLHLLPSKVYLLTLARSWVLSTAPPLHHHHHQALSLALLPPSLSSICLPSCWSFRFSSLLPPPSLRNVTTNILRLHTVSALINAPWTVPGPDLCPTWSWKALDGQAWTIWRTAFQC